MKAKHFGLIFLLFVLFLFYGCGEKKKVEVTNEINSETSIDADVSDVNDEIENIEGMELDQIDTDLEYLEDI